MGGSVPLWVIVTFACLGIALGVTIVMLVRMHKRLGVFMQGKDGESLEATLHWLTQKVASIDDTLVHHKEALEFIDKRVSKSIRGYSLIRYDAYVGAGGEQSFSSGLLDEEGNGFILSVVSNRSHTGVYAKKVIEGIAESSLTEEETLALNEAKKSASQH